MVCELVTFRTMLAVRLMAVWAKRIDGMGVVTRLRLIIGDDGELYECRNCGSKFDHEPDTCPTCGSAEIAHYEF
ncbi:hypothetical protein SAMN04515672_1268 [Natronorubrum texcoconense]|uniref:Uncharacterized protein n=1 Tax=Natronorubrum texcoconense TaxID=1095776 RepID=A0A1G8VC24_9EURY|nr:hypothetical protein SAMN04515672_1268 [Natronorubrum texcoconense]